jgi:hypothetical protein
VVLIVLGHEPLLQSELNNSYRPPPPGILLHMYVHAFRTSPESVLHVAVPASKVATPVVPLQYMRAEPVLPNVVVATYPE